MRWQLALACMGLAGCHIIPPAATAAFSGATATVAVATRNANLGLEIAKPINSMVVCPIAMKDPHDAKTAAAIKAFCANLPSTVDDIPIQARAVVQAIDAVP